MALFGLVSRVFQSMSSIREQALWPRDGAKRCVAFIGNERGKDQKHDKEQRSENDHVTFQLGRDQGRTAKYQSRYQSGRSSAPRMVGSGALDNSGAPTNEANASRSATIATPKTTSRHAA